MEIHLLNDQEKVRVDQPRLRLKVEEVLRDLGLDEAELSLVLTDDERIAELNRKYLGRDGATNVISFSQLEGQFGQLHPELLGDVVVSVETAAREAEAAGKPLNWAIDRLVVHGILHLVGFDHETPDSDSEAMDRRQDELMARLGWD